jgi:putative transposase
VTETAVAELAPAVGTAAACRALVVSRAGIYRHRSPRPAAAPGPRSPSPRALSTAEREVVLGHLHSPRFVDAAPAQVYAALLDEGLYLASERTMYRLLDAAGEIRERRNQLRRPNYARPELLASRPNELWSWDITKLMGPQKWTYYYLYVILDVYSRYIVGWTVAHRESAVLAEQLISETLAKQGILPGKLTIHADRGSSMTSKPVALLLTDLGVLKTHSRPHVSNDNPYSESQFRTLKYRPSFPARFGSIQDARAFCRDFFPWYNGEHRHSGLGLCTPESVHHGRAQTIRDVRATVLTAAYILHPERFVRHHPQPPPLPIAAWINPPLAKMAQEASPRQTRAAGPASQPPEWFALPSNTSVSSLPKASPALPTPEDCLLTN